MEDQPDLNSIKTKEYGEIAYSTQEQIKIRRAIERHNLWMKVLIAVLILLIMVIVSALLLAVKTQVIGQFLYWLANVRIR